MMVYFISCINLIPTDLKKKKSGAKGENLHEVNLAESVNCAQAKKPWVTEG